MPCGDERSLRDSCFANETLGSSDYFVAPRFQCDRHQEGGDQSKGNADSESGQQVDAHFRNGGIDQKQTAEGEQSDPSDGEDSVGRELGFGREESKGAQNQDQGRKASRKQIESEGGDAG